MDVRACLYCKSSNLQPVSHRSDGRQILACQECHLMMVNRLAEDTESLYADHYFEKSDDTKSGYTDYLSQPVTNVYGKFSFARMMAPTSVRHLDLGCADGSLMEVFAANGYQTHGYDISEYATARARDKGLTARATNLKPFPNDEYSPQVITAFDLLEHVDAPGDVLRSIHQRLEFGGAFVFSTLDVRLPKIDEYWFNNSLEHYVYFNNRSLSHILTEVFGADNFYFESIEINGITEFWGVAQKQKLTFEPGLLAAIIQEDVSRISKEHYFDAVMFACQLAKFEFAITLIGQLKQSSTTARLARMATFYIDYYQGHYEALVESSQNTNFAVGINEPLYWQTLSYSVSKLAEIKQAAMRSESESEIIALREEVFVYKDELYRLMNSRVTGRIIKVIGRLNVIRGRVRDRSNRLISLVKQTIKRVIRAYLPKRVRIVLRDFYRYGFKIQSAQIKPYKNKLWPHNKPLLTVVIPYYNRANTIDETIASLDAQTFTSFEIIVVDDGSSADSAIYKLSQLENHPEIRVIRQRNQGVAEARNNGIRSARGKYIMCLDSDDTIQPTYLEKAVVALESDPAISLITVDRKDFGTIPGDTRYAPYDAANLIENNMVVTAAVFRIEAWRSVGGYESGIGYEDWDLWLSMAEKGYWGRLIPEQLFNYRTSMQSRFIEDKDIHWSNVEVIRKRHENYRKLIAKVGEQRKFARYEVTRETALLNIDHSNFVSVPSSRMRVMVVIPWMTFGGAETLLYNFCRETKQSVEYIFVTGLPSLHEWQYKFEAISPFIYHLPNLFGEREELFLEYMYRLIERNDIRIMHSIHNGWSMDYVPHLKRRFPDLKIIITTFNDRAPFYDQSLALHEYVDEYTSDNHYIADRYKKDVPDVPALAIPNGLNCYEEYNPKLFNRPDERSKLSIGKETVSIFYIGRLSEEKNPVVYIEAAKTYIGRNPNADVQFFVVGNGPEQKAVINAIGRESKIAYLGYQAIIGPYLAAADIVVLPSAVEGFPQSILEAMAMECAMVASDVGDVARVITDGKDGLVVTPNDPMVIVDALVRLIENPDFRLLIQRAARETTLSKYSNVTLGNNYRKLYERHLRS